MNKSLMDFNYYQAVVDTGNLISLWIKKNDLETSNILVIIENHLEEKHGPFTSILSDQLDIKDNLGLKIPNSYWFGVKETINLIKNFLIWKENKNSTRSITNFLDEMIHKSQLKLIPEDDSLLISALGLTFDSEFESKVELNYSDSTETNLVSSESNNSVESQISEAPSENIIEEDSLSISEINKEEATIPTITFKEEEKILISQTKSEEIPSQSDISLKEEISSSSFESKIEKSLSPKIEKEKSLFSLSESISHESPIIETDIQEEPEQRDYLRSALDELNKFSTEKEKEKELDNIEIKIKDSMFWTPSNNNDTENLKPVEVAKSESGLVQDAVEIKKEVIKESEDDDDESKLLSSSLREALKMLREED